MDVVFEDSPGWGLTGRLSALAKRKKLTIPVCTICSNIKSTLRKQTAIWALIALAGFVVGCVLSFEVLVPMLDNTDWEMAGMVPMFLFGGLPFLKMVKYWQLKDQGGALVSPVGEEEGRLVLAFASADAAGKVANALGVDVDVGG